VHEISALLEQAGAMPYGEARSVLVEGALRRAEALGDDVLAFDARMELTECYTHGGEPAKSFATFSRCLAEFDAEPARFDRMRMLTLLWHFKWIVSGLTKFPEVPLVRAYDALDDMERRYREAGEGLQPVYAHRCHIAAHVGDPSADDWFIRWRTEPRGTLSDCEGCDPTAQVEFLVSRGRDTTAVELAAPIVAGTLTCTEQPQDILTALLVPYVRTGRTAEAAAAHRRAYRVMRGRAHNVEELAAHLSFCALTGNEARGLEILRAELPLLDRAPSPRAEMAFAASAALLLRRVAESGYGSADDQATQERLAARARSIAARFDQRNGTAEQGKRVEAVLAAEPLSGFLPLTPHAKRVVVPAAPPAAETAGTAGIAGTGGTAEELMNQAEAAWSAGDLDRALGAWERFDQRFPGQLPGRRADGRGLAAAVRGDLDGAAAEWARAAGLHRAAGDQRRHHAALGRLGLTYCQRGRIAEGLPLVEASHKALKASRAAAEPSQAFGAFEVEARYARAAMSRLAQALAIAGRTGEAVALLADATDGELLLLRANLLAPARPGDALAAVIQARDALRAVGDRDSLARAALLHAHLLVQDAFDPEEVLGAYGEAVALLSRRDLDTRAVAHAERGELLVRLGRGAEGAEDLIEAVALFTAIGEHERAALARIELGEAYLMTGRPLDAAEAAEEALGLLDDDAQLLAQRLALRSVRGRAAAELGEFEAALADLTDVAERQPDPWDRARAREQAGDVLDQLDRDAEAADAFEAAAGLYASAGDPQGQVRALRRSAVSLRWAGDFAASLGRFTAVRGVVGGLDDPRWDEAATSWEEARTLAALDRVPEALGRAAAARDGFQALGDEEGVERAEWLLGIIRAE
jgi:tetratricopeptide (TPR) repeat protein